jgi:hypothetical protein
MRLAVLVVESRSVGVDAAGYNVGRRNMNKTSAGPATQKNAS